MESWFFASGDEVIYFEKMISPVSKVTALVLHGAGQSDSSRTLAFRESLLEEWISTLAIDFSGHGRSTHNTKWSIQKRIQEAQEAIWLLGSSDWITLIGLSMSGEVCIRLTQIASIAHLVLLAPGIYHRNAIDIPFGNDFSNLIRQNESWKEAKIRDILLWYTGTILLFTPENDTIIPEWVNHLIMDSAPNSRKKRIIIEWAPHMIGKWMNENPNRAKLIASQVWEYLTL